MVSDIHSAIGAYVTDALEPDERADFEAHLAGCEQCSREVAEFSETVGALSELTAVPPPPSLRDSVLGAIGQVRPLPPLPTRSVEPAAPGWPRQVVAPSMADELTVRRQRRTVRLLSLAVAAALVIALGLGGWVYSLVQQQQAQVTQAQLESELFSAPDVRVYTSTVEGRGQVSFVVSKRLNRAMFIGNDLTDAGPDRRYQLWTIDKTATPVPDNLLDGGQTVKQWFRGDVRDAAGLAVTIEPRRGSTKPTEPILSLVTL